MRYSARVLQRAETKATTHRRTEADRTHTRRIPKGALQVNRATQITTVIGYVLAVPPLLGIVRALRDPAGRLLWIPISCRVALAAELIGAGCVTASWIAAGRTGSAIFNGLWVIVCSTIWLRSENKLRLQRQHATDLTTT